MTPRNTENDTNNVEEENNNVMSRHGHRIETSLEGIGHLSKEN